MDRSPPSLTRSPASSADTDSSRLHGYPSPVLLDPLYGQPCPSIMAQETMDVPDWAGASSPQPPCSSLLPTGADYSFGAYEPGLHAAYPHQDLCARASHHHLSNNPPSLVTTTPSRSPDPSSMRSSYPYPRLASPSRVKMESDYPVDVAPYPSPRMDSAHYSSRASSAAAYPAEVPLAPWPRAEYPPMAGDGLYAGHGAAPYASSASSSERHVAKPSRAPRRQPRKLTTKEEANFQCGVKGCGKLFSRSYNFKAHLETHDEKREYPFPCQVPDCTKRFVRKTDLQRHHQSVHMKERNHKCDYCGRMFARKDTLRRHMEDGCSKRFDIGTLDLRSEYFDAYGSAPRHLGGTTGPLAPPGNLLPPMAVAPSPHDHSYNTRR